MGNKVASPESGPRVSVVLRSHNDRDLLRKTLAMLARQTLVPAEILVCDDRSTDGTMELAGEFPGVRFETNADGAYVPGRILNAAVGGCSGDIVVFNNSDALILTEDYIEKLTAPFADPDVAAVYANQRPRPDAAWWVVKDYERAFGDGATAAQWGSFFSLAGSAARRELLLAEPFSETLQYSEDVEWSVRMRRAGRRIVYAAEAKCEHSHNYTLAQVWKRFYNEGLADAVIFQDSPSFFRFVRRWGMETLRDWTFLMRRGEWRGMFEAPVLRAVQKWAHYRGLAAGRCGREEASC